MANQEIILAERIINVMYRYFFLINSKLGCSSIRIVAFCLGLKLACRRQPGKIVNYIEMKIVKMRCATCALQRKTVRMIKVRNFDLDHALRCESDIGYSTGSDSRDPAN